MSRVVVVVVLTCCALHLVLADEDPDTHQQRMKNIASFEKKGKKPWSVTYSVSEDDHHESTSKQVNVHAHSTRTSHGTGGGRMTFFVEDDATPHQFSIDGNGALWKDNNGRGSMSETFDSSRTESGCGAASTSHDERSAPSLTCLPFFEIDDDQHLWRFSVGCDGDGSTKHDARFPDVSAGCGMREQHDTGREQVHIGNECTNDTPGAKLTRDKDGYTIDCTIVDDHSKNTNSDEQITGKRTSVLHGRIEFKATLKYYATLEPQDENAYEKWRPEGPPLDGKSVKGKDGNKLGLKIVLRDATTSSPVSDKAYDASVALTASHVPGVAMNYPPLREVDTDADLRFVQAGNTGTVKGKENEVLSFTGVRGEAKLEVTARDYGAYGVVAAVVTVDGSQVEVRAAAGGRETDTFSVPRDINKNHIADGWEDQYGILRASYPPTWDEEDTPAMYNKGDGISLYDEYRGFYLQRTGAKDKKAKAEHVALSPKDRELLVAVDAPGWETFAYAGAHDYEQARGVVVHYIPDAKYAVPLSSDDEKGRPRDANFNRSKTETLEKPLAGLWVIVDKETKMGPAHTPPTSAVADVLSYLSPAYTSGVHVHAPACAKEIDIMVHEAKQKIGPDDAQLPIAIQADLAGRHMSAADLESQVTANKVALTAELVEFTVMHEMGHATGAQHHELADYNACQWTCPAGEGDCEARGCPAYTATSRRTLACSEAKKSATELMDYWDVYPHLGDKAWVASHDMQCYGAQAEHFGGGDENCPMRYWHFLDAKRIVAYLTGEWNLPKSGPSGAWKFCTKENAGTMRLHEEASDLLQPPLRRLHGPK